MADHFSDRLAKLIRKKGTCVCVGLDPRYDRLPQQIIGRKDMNDGMDVPVALDAMMEFSTRVLKVVAPIVPAVKINVAFFERYYWDGMDTYFSLVQEAEALDLEVIGDIKRGDIGSTAESYAAGHIKNSEYVDMDYMVAPDAITVNGFAGLDGIKPFAETAVVDGKGIFVWVRASNPSAASLHNFTNAEGKKFYEELADQVASLGRDKQYIGSSNYSDIGMVVGGVTGAEAERLRSQYPQTIFLVPGYGAQGAQAEDCLKFCKADGTGALISASRSIIYAYENPKYTDQFGDNWEKCVEQACLDMKKELSDIQGQQEWNF